MPHGITARTVVSALKSASSPQQAHQVARFFRGNDDGNAPDNRIMGVPFGKIFTIAKKSVTTPLAEIEKLLESPYYEVRMAAVSIMDFQARAKSTIDAERKALFDLYLRRHDRINNWDLVDRAAPHVIGHYLADKSRRPLYRLARSKNPWEQRTAIVATFWFIRAGEVADTFAIADLLVHSKHELVQKAVGSWIREAGKRDRRALITFLERHSPHMSATMIRYATERLGAADQARFAKSTRAMSS